MIRGCNVPEVTDSNGKTLKLTIMIGDLNDNIKINYKKLSQKIINLVFVDNTVVAIRHCRYQHSGCNITSQFFPKKEEKKVRGEEGLATHFNEISVCQMHYTGSVKT